MIGGVFTVGCCAASASSTASSVEHPIQIESPAKMLDRPESRPRCLCGVHALLQMTEDRKSNTLTLCARREEHVRANQPNLDEVGSLILLLANFFRDSIGRPGIEGRQ